MCGRFALSAPEELASRFKLKNAPELAPRYNIAPSQDVAVVRLVPGTLEPEIVMLRWGLIPFWARDRKIGYKMINARGESIADKPAFRAAFKHRHCLIPASGFYEWDHKTQTNRPYFIRQKDTDILAFAGLWEHWQGEDGETVESCTIITTNANRIVGKIHDRMPVIIEPDKYDQWLDPELDKEIRLTLLKPFQDKRLLAYPVGKAVNNPKNDTPDCLEEIKD
jgi:putative SOS response-associated peptidase YedK